ncbi:Acyl-CoA-binding protein [Ceraceosorus bombacis]|uniref:Acyl-CoA-binding protein n=2 Tax=Ceraceosorus TaxID=401624 RepID=A0A0P1B8X3_9BASI|nr:acyl-CoA binding protein [Ceraceosorus guamensis]PWN39595.1 acyl-CoA binding protein [Ceraceosorus guamensis]CEH12041.1 Acyl-CoA-binding protein [Ceraceosorus bombacis]
MSTIPQDPQFTKAVEIANDPKRGLSIGLGISEKLAYWGLSEQGLKGDVTGDRPGILHVEARLKYDAWAKNQGLDPQEAQKQYIEKFIADLEKHSAKKPQCNEWKAEVLAAKA